MLPRGVPASINVDALGIALRDRLNALLASMIHQHKQILLHDLRAMADGTYTATVTVNELDIALDPMLIELQDKGTSKNHQNGSRSIRGAHVYEQ